MSYVSSIVIICELEDSAILGVQDWLKEHKKPLLLKNENCGGDKNMQCDVWTGAFNYINDEEFTNFCKSLNWEKSATMVLNPEYSYEQGNCVIVLA